MRQFNWDDLQKPVATPPLYAPDCDPWGGDPAGFQEQAREVHDITSYYAWITSTCPTPMCLIHIRVFRPQRLDYQPGVCVYCGLAANTMDHLLPRGWTGNTERNWVPTVPACRECNSSINDAWAPSITERRAIAHEAIRRHHRDVLQVVPRTAAELCELGPNLRSYVVQGMAARELVEIRLAWPESPSYDLDAIIRSGIDNPYANGLLTLESSS